MKILDYTALTALTGTETFLVESSGTKKITSAAMKAYFGGSSGLTQAQVDARITARTVGVLAVNTTPANALWAVRNGIGSGSSRNPAFRTLEVNMPTSAGLWPSKGMYTLSGLADGGSTGYMALALCADTGIVYIIRSTTNDPVNGNTLIERLLIGDINGNPKLTSPEVRRNTFRGELLGTTSYDATRFQPMISSGEFEGMINGVYRDIYVGDYWRDDAQGINWRVTDIDYYLNTGDVSFTRHHLVIVPDRNIGTGTFNDVDDNTGYAGSTIRTIYLEENKTIVQNFFGNMLLTHRVHLTNSFDDINGASLGTYDSTLELMSQVNITGSQSYKHNGDSGFDNYQFALFAIDLKFANLRLPSACWTRDFVDNTYGVVYSTSGYFYKAHMGTARLIRPSFCIG